MLRLSAITATALLSLSPGLAQQAKSDRIEPRSESFAFWQPSKTNGVETLAGYAQWRRRDLTDGSAQLELELLFVRGSRGDERRRVVHVEHLGDDGPHLVWREIAAKGGRTLSLALRRDGTGWNCEEWEGAASLATTLDASAGAALPLYTLELVRTGQLAAGPCSVFDPLTRAFEHLSLSTNHRLEASSPTKTDSEPAVSERQAEFVRTDGTLAGRYVFRGRSLESFQWQEGGAIARRISAEDYERAAVASAEIERPQHP